MCSEIVPKPSLRFLVAVLPRVMTGLTNQHTPCSTGVGPVAASSHCSRVLSSVSQMAARGKGRRQTRCVLSCASSAFTYGSWHSALVSSLSVSTSEVVGWHEQGFITTQASSLAAGPVRTKHAARAKKTSQVIRPKETLADNRCPLLPRGVGTGGRAGHGNRQPVPCPPPLGKLLPPPKRG